MMHLFIASTTLIIIPWLIKPKYIWTSSMFKSILLCIISIKIIKSNSFTLWHNMFLKFAIDNLSSPLMILSAWLVPISYMASMYTLKKQPLKTQQIFISLMAFILFSLLLTFSALELSLFYIAFEATLLPTLILMSRWGAQKERFQASIYFLFYTLAGSLPLLIGLISLYKIKLSLMMPSTSLMKNISSSFNLYTLSFWWMFFLIAFTMKMPIYGFHLWLPKAHVEAPMAGSMILAAILLKLGGYGLARTILMFFTISASTISFPLITFCMWGSLITSIICLRQTDLKALIAYSSVGHMSMVASGMFSLSSWGIKGALTLMIAHGLISSSLFCLANLMYERKSTRTLAMTRGFKLLTPLLSLWWIMTCMSNLGLPPTPNLIGELFIMCSIINWKMSSLLIMTLTTMFSAMYSLLMFKQTNKKTFPTFLSKISPINSTEHFLIFLHLFPLFLLILYPNLLMMA